MLEPSEVMVTTSQSHSSKDQSSTTATKALETASVLYNENQMDSDIASAMPTMVIGPSTTLVDQSDSFSTTAIIKPGSVIELSDLLKGVQDAGQIGETIKDIVNNIVTKPDMPMEDPTTTTEAYEEEETTEPSMMPEVSTLWPSFNPSTSSEKTSTSLNAIKKPDAKFPVYIAPQNQPKYTTTAEEKVIFTQVDGNGEQEKPMSTRYVTSIEKSAKTLTLTSTKVCLMSLTE